jgi:hypothetical protein
MKKEASHKFIELMKSFHLSRVEGADYIIPPVGC